MAPLLSLSSPPIVSSVSSPKKKAAPKSLFPDHTLPPRCTQSYLTTRNWCWAATTHTGREAYKGYRFSLRGSSGLPGNLQLRAPTAREQDRDRRAWREIEPAFGLRSSRGLYVSASLPGPLIRLPVTPWFFLSGTALSAFHLYLCVAAVISLFPFLYPSLRYDSPAWANREATTRRGKRHTTSTLDVSKLLGISCIMAFSHPPCQGASHVFRFPSIIITSCRFISGVAIRVQPRRLSCNCPCRRISTNHRDRRNG